MACGGWQRSVQRKSCIRAEGGACARGGGQVRETKRLCGRKGGIRMTDTEATQRSALHTSPQARAHLQAAVKGIGQGVAGRRHRRPVAVAPPGRPRRAAAAAATRAAPCRGRLLCTAEGKASKRETSACVMFQQRPTAPSRARRPSPRHSLRNADHSVPSPPPPPPPPPALHPARCGPPSPAPPRSRPSSSPPALWRCSRWPPPCPQPGPPRPSGSTPQRQPQPASARRRPPRPRPVRARMRARVRVSVCDASATKWRLARSHDGPDACAAP